MASATAKTTLAPALWPAIADVRSSSRQQVATSSSQSIGLPSLPVPRQPSSPARYAKDTDSWKSICYRRTIGRNVTAKVTGEAPTEVVAEVPEIIKTIQEAWDKLEDKFAVTSLAFATLIALYGATGIISAIDRLPLVPGLFELVGIGYSGWFAYRNFVFKPDREVLIAKIKSIYSDVI